MEPWDLVPPCEPGDWPLSVTAVGDWTPASACASGDWNQEIFGGILLEDSSGHWLTEDGEGGWLFG